MVNLLVVIASEKLAAFHFTENIMIKNIPTHQEFEKLGIQCVSKAFNMLYVIENKYAEMCEHGTISEEMVSPRELWESNEITVRTSLIVLFQGIEYLMKMEVTKESALLLIDNDRKHWPTLPEKDDKDYNELQTVSGENLLSVFCAVANSTFDLDRFVRQFQELRVKRNKLVHSTGVEDLDYKYIVKQVFYFLSFFYRKDKWLEIFREMFTSSPIFGHWDPDIEEAYFYTVLNFVEKIMGKSELSKFLPHNFKMKSRRYLCPECTSWLNQYTNDELHPKWSFLKPNKRESTVIHCLICDSEYEVERKKCNLDSCKGNVLYYETGFTSLCLTCFGEIEIEDN